MGWYAKKWERSQMVGLWETFAVKWKSLICKNQNKKNLLIKKYVQYSIDVFQISELCKNHKIFLINTLLKVVL